MKGWKKSISIITIMAFIFPVYAAAENQIKDVYRLGEVVVSATRSEIPVFDAPQDVTVLSSEEIMASPFERVEDIVRSVPGVYNTRHYGTQKGGVASPIKMRGVGRNRVLVLVDGVPQNDNFNNAIAWVAWGHIPRETIERIEIVRGPTSALYGSEGLGGVIHIITKKPQSQRQSSIRAEAGTAETYGGSIFHNQKIKDLGLLLSGGYEESDGFYMTESPESYNIKRYREAGKVLGKVSYTTGEASDLTISALYYDHETGKGRKYFYDELQLDQYWMNYSQQTESLRLNGLIYLNHADKTAYQDTAKDNYTSLYRVEKLPSTNTWGADLQGTISSWEKAQLTIGASFKEASWKYDEDYPQSTRDAGAEGKQRFISPFTNLNFHLFQDSLFLDLGARYDWIKTSGGANWDTKPDGGAPAYDNRYSPEKNNNFSPKLGIAYHPDDKTTLRASGGKGFRSPSLFELYKVHVRSGGRYYRAANPKLKPEEIWSYEVGAERFLLDKLWGKATIYQSFAKDYIGDRLTNSYEKKGKTYNEYILDNINEVDIQGFETELQWYALNDLTIFGNYTYNISKISKDEADKTQEGQYLTDDPRQKIHLVIRYQNPRIMNITLGWNRYIDKYYDVDEVTQAKDNFWGADLAVSRKFFNKLTAYLNVENIFDSVDNEGISPGTIFNGGLKFEF